MFRSALISSSEMSLTGDGRRIPALLTRMSSPEAEARDFAQEHCAEMMAEFQGLLLALAQGWEVLEPEERELDRVGTSH
jgi:hypothetical protein